MKLSGPATRRIAILALLVLWLQSAATAQVNESAYVKWFKWDDNGATTHVYGEVRNPGTFDVSGLALKYVATDNQGHRIAQYRQTVAGPILAGSSVSFDFTVPDSGKTFEAVLFVDASP